MQGVKMQYISILFHPDYRHKYIHANRRLRNLTASAHRCVVVDFGVKKIELNTPKRSDFRPIEAFFSSPYSSMPSEKKHSAESKLRPFRCFAVLKEQIFVTARRKSARNTRLFQRFSTKLWQKYAIQNRMQFNLFYPTTGGESHPAPRIYI